MSHFIEALLLEADLWFALSMTLWMVPFAISDVLTEEWLPDAPELTDWPPPEGPA